MQLADAPLVANLPAQDLDRAMRWYEEKLGLKPILDIGVGGQLYRTGGVLWLIYPTPFAGTGKHTSPGGRCRTRRGDGRAPGEGRRVRGLRHGRSGPDHRERRGART